MRPARRLVPFLIFVFVLLAAMAPRGATAAESVLPSWNDGASRKAILDFVARATTPGSPDFVPEAERVAVFDNDGTLWAEHPVYFQMAFALDQVKRLAPEHPEWTTTEPFKSILNGDMRALATMDKRTLTPIFMTTYASMTVEDYRRSVVEWLGTARHPRYNRPYTECVYQPMLELLDFLRANGFKNFIVSGGDMDFMRPWTERVYGIPPERVVGSNANFDLETREGKPVIVRLPAVESGVNADGKPIAIHKYIGRRPILACGNSDGDLAMLRYTAAGSGARLMIFIHHDDAEREYAYDRKSDIGRLDKGLDEALRLGWTVVGMKNDFALVLPPEK